MDKAFLDFIWEYVPENKRKLFSKLIELRTRYLAVVLEDLYQPHNASAVMRTCDCFGIQDIHVIENRNKWEHSPHVEQGSSKWLSLNRYQDGDFNSPECLAKLKASGYKIVATTPHTEMILEDVPLTNPLALVFGTEEKGVSDYILDEADYKVRIPMYGFTESFNISVAAAVTIHTYRHKLDVDTPKELWELSENEKVEILLDWSQKTLRHPKRYIQEFESKKKD